MHITKELTIRGGEGVLRQPRRGRNNPFFKWPTNTLENQRWSKDLERKKKKVHFGGSRVQRSFLRQRKRVKYKVRRKMGGGLESLPSLGGLLEGNSGVKELEN